MKNRCRRPSRSQKEPRLGFRPASTLEGWDSTTTPSGGNDARTSSLPARPRPDWVFLRRPSPVDLPQVYHCSTAIQASASAWAPLHPRPLLAVSTCCHLTGSASTSLTYRCGGPRAQAVLDVPWLRLLAPRPPASSPRTAQLPAMPPSPCRLSAESPSPC